MSSSLALVSDTESFCIAAADWPPIAPDRFTERSATLRAQFTAFNDPASVPGDPIAPLFAHLAKTLPADAIVCNGAGNYAGWLHRFYRFRAPGSQLAPTSGSMGYGLPGAVGAAATCPEREVYAIAGDGCFMMTCQEMATACHHNLAITVIVINNNRYGTIRAHQEREFPGGISGTALRNPNFCALARSFGARGWHAAGLAAFEIALSEAREQGGVNLIEVPLDATYLSPGNTIQ